MYASATRLIPAPHDRVWDRLTDLQRLPLWVGLFEDVQRPSAAVAVLGSTWQSRVSNPTQESAAEVLPFRVYAYEPKRVLGFQHAAENPLMAVAWRLKPVDGERSIVTETIDLAYVEVPRGCLTMLFGRMLTLTIAHAATLDLQRLAQLIAPTTTAVR